MTENLPWTEEPGRLQSIGLQRLRQLSTIIIYMDCNSYLQNNLQC